MKKLICRGIGSILYFAPNLSTIELYELTPYETENTSTSIRKYWQNVGNYLKKQIKNI